MTKHISLLENHAIANTCYNANTPVFYLLADYQPAFESLITQLPCDINWVLLYETDWETQFTPWQAPALFKQQKAFAGNAMPYLQNLIQTRIPAIEKALAITPNQRGILGYSLGGLFVAYSCLLSDFFTYSGCVSGSLWYPDFVDFVVKQQPKHKPKALYFSLGETEAHSKNSLLQNVEQATTRLVDFWQQQQVNTTFVLNAGGHFHAPAQRLQAALYWLQQQAYNTERHP